MDYYAVLGVARDAEDIVITAAYKAMVKKYHPDVYTGSKAQANKKIREINEAYDTLSDPEKRAAYDKSIDSEGESVGDYETFEDEDDTSAILAEDWAIVAEYFPDAEESRKRLGKLSQSSALYFQIIILESKAGENQQEIADLVKAIFLERYFGTNSRLHKFVEQLLLKGHRSIAREINKAIKVLGTNASANIIGNIKKKYGFELYGKKSDGSYKWADPFERFLYSYEFPGEYEYFIETSYIPAKKQLNVTVTCVETAGTVINDEKREYDVVYFEVDTKNSIITIEPNNENYRQVSKYKDEEEALVLIRECLDEHA